MTEQCFLVKDVGDIVSMSEWQGECAFVPPTEYEIVAIDDEMAWIRRTDQPRSMGKIVQLDRLTFVRSTVAQDFEPALDHAVDPFEAIPLYCDSGSGMSELQRGEMLSCGDGVVGD